MSIFTFAQKVESGAYNLMLKTMLSHNVEEVEVCDVKDKQSEVILLDSRSKEEYEVSHLKGARWVGYDDFDTSRVSGIPKDKKIVVYCSVGYRSEKITEKLNAAGYKSVYNMYGGIFEWVNRGYPVYRNGKQTKKVHAYNKKWGVWLKEGEKVY